MLLLTVLLITLSLPVDIAVADKETATSATSPPAGERKDVVEKEKPEAKKPEEEAKAGYITVNFKGADIRTVLAYISDVAGVDIVPSPDVKGPVDLKLTNKPWQIALDVIVRNYGYTYEREGDIIRIITIDKLKQEELETKVFTLNYAKPENVVKSIEDILTKRGKAVFDARTNTVLVTDIPTNLYKISQIIERLDRETPQVLIEARIIETVLSDAERLGIDWSLRVTATGASRPTTIPFNRFNAPFGMEEKGITQYLPRTKGARQYTASEGAFMETTSEFPTEFHGIGPMPLAEKGDFTFGTLDFTQFSAVMEFLKSRSDTDIISNPRIATLNNKQASILIGQTLNLPTYERNNTTGRMEITGYEPKDLGIKLTVTPHVNDRGEITVDLRPEISDLLRYDTLDTATGVRAPVFSVRQAVTQIMVRDGDTIFIGGLLKENDTKVNRPIPFFGDLLGDIPVLGLLFTKKEVTTQKSELIFFLTVHLINRDKKIMGIPDISQVYVPKHELYRTMEQGKGEKKKRRKRMK